MNTYRVGGYPQPLVTITTSRKLDASAVTKAAELALAGLQPHESSVYESGKSRDGLAWSVSVTR